MNINISGVTYTNGIDNNINQNQQPGQIQINVPAGLSSKEAGIALLQNLAPGDVFSGEITDINQNTITLALSDSVSVSATLSDALSYNIGDKASFSIKNNSGEQIVLKSVPRDNSNLMNEQTIRSAITAAGYSINNTTVELVDNLMKQQMPIDRESIHYFMRMLESVPEATPEDVVLMTKMGLPVTEENVQALHDYYNFNHNQLVNTKIMGDSVMDIINSFDNESIENNQLGTFIRDFVNAYGEPSTPAENINSFLNEDVRNELANIIDGNMAEEAAGNPSALAQKIIDGNITAKEFLLEFAGHDFSDKSVIKAFITTDAFSDIVNNFIRQQNFIPPEQVSKENLKKLYAKILTDNKNLEEKFAGNPKMSSITNLAASNTSDINLMNQMNHFMNFVQIPLKMSGQNAQGDLYVYRRNKERAANEPLKALLHLDMDNLGAMDILVTLKDKNVTTNFKVETEEILDYIEEHMDELTVALNRLGYTVNSQASVNDGKYNFKKDVIMEEVPPKQILRYSFDVRA